MAFAAPSPAAPTHPTPDRHACARPATGYYRKVQVSLDEEERAFQETLTRASLQDDGLALDGCDHEKLQMLETYMASLGSAVREERVRESNSTASGAPMLSNAEAVDKFMADLAATAGSAAAGGAGWGDGAGREAGYAPGSSTRRV